MSDDLALRPGRAGRSYLFLSNLAVLSLVLLPPAGITSTALLPGALLLAIAAAAVSSSRVRVTGGQDELVVVNRVRTYRVPAQHVRLESEPREVGFGQMIALSIKAPGRDARVVLEATVALDAEALN